MTCTMVALAARTTRLVGVMAALHSSLVQTGSPPEVVTCTTRLSGVRARLQAGRSVVRNAIWMATLWPTLIPSATTGVSWI